MVVTSEGPKPATAPAPSVVPVAAPKNAPSIINADLTIRGTLISDREVQLAGRVEGDIRVATLVLREQAYVIGDVFAKEVVVGGRVVGNIHAGKVRLTTTANVQGDVIHGGSLAIEPGANFEGNCHADRTTSFTVAAE